MRSWCSRCLRSRSCRLAPRSVVYTFSMPCVRSPGQRQLHEKNYRTIATRIDDQLSQTCVRPLRPVDSGGVNITPSSLPSDTSIVRPSARSLAQRRRRARELAAKAGARTTFKFKTNDDQNPPVPSPHTQPSEHTSTLHPNTSRIISAADSRTQTNFTPVDHPSPSVPPVPSQHPHPHHPSSTSQEPVVTDVSSPPVRISTEGPSAPSLTRPHGQTRKCNTTHGEQRSVAVEIEGESSDRLLDCHPTPHLRTPVPPSRVNSPQITDRFNREHAFLHVPPLLLDTPEPCLCGECFASYIPSCSPRVPAIAATPSQSANLSHSPTWRFHDRFRFITHDARQCDVCDSWITHFMRDIVLREDTLAEAETQRDAAVLGQLPAECAELRKSLDATRAEMSTLRHAFDDLHRQHRRTSDQLDHLRGELSEAHAQLRYEAAKNARGRTPFQRKVVRQQGTSPSAPSRFSPRPDSLVLEDRVALMNPVQNQNTAPWGLDGGESRKGQPAAAKVTWSGPETMRAKKSDVDA